MMERWLQITCDGCGETECNTMPNETVDSFRREMRVSGWRKTGRFDFCGRCRREPSIDKNLSIFDSRNSGT
jgi:hypothetical protein